MTNARFVSLYGLPVALLPFDDVRSTLQICALVTSLHSAGRKRGWLPSAARRWALRYLVQMGGVWRMICAPSCGWDWIATLIPTR